MRKLTAILCALTLVAAPAGAAPRSPRGGTTDSDLVAEAPQTADAALAQAARDTFAEGLRWYKKRKYDQALAAFLQAYALSKSPVIHVNLGLTQLRLGNAIAAIQEFEQYLAEAKDAPPERRARVEARLAEARAQVGRIAVSAPEGAEISVDGQSVGHAPLARAVDVAPGRHEVSMTSPAGNKTDNVEVAKGAQVEIKLLPARVASRPPPAPAAREQPATPEAPSLFSAPETPAPTYVAGAIGVVAFTTTLVIGGIRVNATRNASAVTEALVRNQKNPASCNDARALAADPTIGDACSTLRSATHTLDETKGPFAIALWTSVGATAAALGWYFLAPKATASATTGALSRPIGIAPVVTRDGASVGVTGAF